MDDFGKIVLSAREVRQLRKMIKSGAFVLPDPQVRTAFSSYGFLDRQIVGVDSLGGPVYGKPVRANARASRYLLYRRQAIWRSDVRYWITTGISLAALIGAYRNEILSLLRTIAQLLTDKAGG